MNDDARIIRAVLEQDGARKGSPVMQALERLEAKAARLDWALPLLGGEDTPEANERTVRLAMAVMKGHSGEAAIVEAMKS